MVLPWSHFLDIPSIESSSNIEHLLFILSSSRCQFCDNFHYLIGCLLCKTCLTGIEQRIEEEEEVEEEKTKNINPVLCLANKEIERAQANERIQNERSKINIKWTETFHCSVTTVAGCLSINQSIKQLCTYVFVTLKVKSDSNFSYRSNI